ncbi:MAG TPA: DUF6709 family protein [Candidatus Polarisedimenticolia bacterium]|nr:DUF6709 family protein [Candidatus Polarisedimenticolia bacterium]
MDPWIQRMCRRESLHQMVPWALVAVSGLALILANARYFINFIGGPFPVSPADLGAVPDPTQSLKYFVRVSGDHAVDTGIQEITVETHGGVKIPRGITASYYALDLGGKLLIVKSVSGQPLIVEGKLAHLPRSLETQLFATAEARSMRDHVYPFYLDASGHFRSAGWLVIVLCHAFVGLAAWKVFPIWRRWQNPATHPVMQQAASWGDPAQISAEIENELQAAGGLRAYRIFTRSYMIEASFFRFNVLRFRDLVWAYKRVIKKRVNFVPSGTDYHALFICYGGSTVAQGSEKMIHELLQAAAQRAPWAIFGYTEELAKAFKEHPRDFCAAVEERRREACSS